VRDRIATALFVLSAALLAGTATAAWLTKPRSDVGRVPDTVMRDHVTAAASSAVPSSEIGAGRTATPGTAVVVRSARLSDVIPLPDSPRPVSLTIEAIGVRARVVSVGVETVTHAVVVPDDVRDVGWYRFGPVPGRTGSAVLLGHVDSRIQGPGVFFRLRTLVPGDIVRVGFADATRASFEVVGRRSYPKGQLPPTIFTRAGPPVLTLVTCGGSFDETAARYSDNVVVFAVPLHG
jgi:Sortase domain